MKHRPSPADIEHMGRVKSLPCIVCDMRGEAQTSPSEAHHIKRDPITGQPLGASQKGDAWTTIPLCSGRHHWNGVHVHMGSKEFEARYGNELDLLALVYERLGVAYPWRRSHDF